MANTRFKAENGLLVTGANSIFEQQVQVNANLTVNSDLLYVGGNLYVQGDQIISGTTVYDTDIIPATTTGRIVGNTINRFDFFGRNFSATGNVLPVTSGGALGNASSRWDTYSTNINASGNITVSGSGSIGTTLAAGNTSVTGFINVSTTANVGTTLTVGGNTSIGGNLSVSGIITMTGNVTMSANATAKALILDNAAIFSNTATVTNTTQNIVDSFPKADADFAKLILTVKPSSGTQRHASEILLLHDGTNVLLTEYADLYNTSLGSFDAGINNANVEIYFTSALANASVTQTVKVIRQVTR
jgi:cytoskeletal protein CcmA (bactofilin family)